MAREKHRREKELTCAKSLRKRRSFLQTDYTSQVTFPLGLPGSVQNRCSWPPPAPLSARPPAPPSAGDTGEDAELGLQAQGDTSPYSDLLEMEPDAMETKSVTESVVSPISAVRLPGEQHGEGGAGGGPQPALAAHPPLLSLPGGQNTAAQERHSTKTDAEWASGESCVATSHGLVQAALEEATTAQHEAGDTSPSPGQDLPCPASKQTPLPPARGPRAAAPREVAQEQEPVATAGGQGVCAEPVPAPCKERKATSDSCAQNSSDGALSQAKSRQAVSMEALWKAHKKTCVGFPDATQLLTDCSSTSGVITRLSWLSLRVRTDPTSPSPSQGRADAPPEFSASQKTSGCLGADAVRTETQTCPAGPPFETELVGHGVDEGQPGSEAGDVADEQPRPVQRPFPTERAPEVGKGSASSLGLPASSGPAPLGSLGRSTGDHGASKHSFLCFNHKDEPSDAITSGPSGFSTEKKTPPVQLGVDQCSCRLSYISCFHRPDDQGEGETPVPTCRAFPGPLTAAPPRRRSLPGTPLGCGDVAWRGPPAQALGWLNDRAQMSPADLSCFLGYTAELQEVVGKLSGNRATHPQEQCAEQRAESKAALGMVSRRLLSSCQGLLSTEQPPRELQGALRATFGHLVQLAEASLQVSHCPRCRQRRRALGAALLDVVGTYRQLLQAAEPRLRGPGCAGLGARLLSRQHTALAAAAFCLLQQL